MSKTLLRHTDKKNIFDIFVETLSYRGLCFVDEYTSERVQFVLLSVLSSSMVDRGFESQSGQTKDYKIGICCFSASQLVTSITEEYIDIPEIRVMCENGVTCLLAD